MSPKSVTSLLTESKAGLNSSWRLSGEMWSLCRSSTWLRSTASICASLPPNGRHSLSVLIAFDCWLHHSLSSFYYSFDLAVFLYVISGLGITAGAHRLWSHRSYRAKWPLRVILCIFNSIAFQVCSVCIYNSGPMIDLTFGFLELHLRVESRSQSSP